VSFRYFSVDDPFADFVIHEMAHVFHNNKRYVIGLPHGRGRDWLLNIDFGKREVFAYSCEVFGRLLELGSSRAERRDLLARHRKAPFLAGADKAEYLDILEEAVGARNGWRRILTRCEPARA
jgi:hypothetical protein